MKLRGAISETVGTAMCVLVCRRDDSAAVTSRPTPPRAMATWCGEAWKPCRPRLNAVVVDDRRQDVEDADDPRGRDELARARPARRDDALAIMTGTEMLTMMCPVTKATR